MLDLLPPELLCEIMQYVGPAAYRILQDNFDGHFNVDTKKMFVSRYYADYIDKAIVGIDDSYYHNDFQASIIFHLQDTIKVVMIDKKNPCKIMAAMIKHCPYIIGHQKIGYGEILIVKTNTLDMKYIDRLHFENTDTSIYDGQIYLLHDSMYKLMPTLEDEIQTKIYNKEIYDIVQYQNEYNKEEFLAIIDLYKHMTLKDFTCYYEDGDYAWNILLGIRCKFQDFDKLEELTHNLLNFKVHPPLNNYDRPTHKQRDNSYLNSRLNVFIPLSRVEEFDEEAIISCLKTKWLETVEVPLHEIEFNGYTPYVAGGSLVRALLNSSEDEGWEGSDWDLYLIPSKHKHENKLNIENLKKLKKNCNERCITYRNKVYELFEISCEINCVDDTIEGDRRSDFFSTVFPECNRSDHPHLQVIIADRQLYQRNMITCTNKKIEHLVRLFDMAPCQIYWDGDHIYVSVLALYCLKNMINVCCMNSLDSRISKYETRGFTTYKVDTMKPNSEYMIWDDTNPQWKFV